MTDWHPVYTILISAAINIIPAFLLIHYQRKIKKSDEDRDKVFADIELNKNKTRSSIISMRKQLEASRIYLEKSWKEDAEHIEEKVSLIQQDMTAIREHLIKIEMNAQNTTRFIDENRQFFGKVNVLENNLGRVETDVRRIFEYIGERRKAE